jgi:DNA-binding response OmpR family regulator
MTRLLMLDMDARLVSAVTRALAQEGIEVIGVPNVERARSCVAERTVDVALLDGDLIDETELSAFAPLPVVLMTSFLEPEGAHRFFRHARLLRKPFTSAQLLSALHETCGTLTAEPATLVDVLRRAHTDKQTLGLAVGEAEIFVERGELIHAERDGKEGESALADVLAEAQSGFSFIPFRAQPRTIQRPFRALLLDLLRHLDEIEQLETAATTQLRPVHKGRES